MLGVQCFGRTHLSYPQDRRLQIWRTLRFGPVTCITCSPELRYETNTALSENLERPNKRASFREEAVRLDSGECVTTNSRKS